MRRLKTMGSLGEGEMQGGPPPADQKQFIYLGLNKGISVFNIISFYIMQSAVYLLSNFILTFFSFLVKSEYYNVPKSSAGTVVGNMGFFSHFICLFFDLSIGTFMDMYGRKKPIIIGLFLSAISLIFMPYGGSLYPNLLILRYEKLLLINFIF